MAGVYIHIPFCAKKCTYCDFHFSTSYHPYRDEMIASIRREIELREFTAPEIQTIYFGGGTPSLLSGEEISVIINEISRKFLLSADVEITLECNPDNCSSENLLSWKNAGVNRLSIGLQSFTDEQLAWMNRPHSANEGIEAVKRAKATGFRNITVDIMYGLPGLSDAGWLTQLEQVVALDVSHISAYCLTVEEKTPLAVWVNQGKIHPPDSDQQSAQFGLLLKQLSGAGYEQYEISNFARNGHYSRHNSAYWQGKTYLGIGPSAHGFDGKERYWNVANNREYIRSVSAGNLPETREILSPNDRFNELILTGLRTKWGVHLGHLKEILHPDDKWFGRVEHWKITGCVIENDGRIFLTEDGKLLADAIASDLFVV